MLTISRQERWLGLGLLLAWSLSHASLFAGGKADSTTPAERIKKALDQPIVLDFGGQTLLEGVQHLKDKTGVNFELDVYTLQQLGLFIPENPQPSPVTLKSDKGKVRHAVQKMLTPYNLTYVILGESVLITTEDMGQYRQMRQRVAVDVNEQPLHTALKDLARRTALNLIIDPRVAKDAQAPVSLQMEDATLETAVRLLAELGNLKAVRMGNVMFVTNETRADKIRKEEKDMNPYNDPRNPIPIHERLFCPGIAGGGVGAAPPAIAPPAAPVPDAPPVPNVEPAPPK